MLRRETALELPKREGTITKVEAQKRRDRVNVFVDDGFAFSLATIVSARAGLRAGMFLSETEATRLEAEDADHVALDAAVTCLASRPKSEQELRHNLARKGLSAELIERAVARLASAKLVDDTAFAQFWVQNRDRFRPRSARAMRSELYVKGVAREVVEVAIAAGDDEEQRARKVAEKSLQRLRGLDNVSFRRRLIAQLLRLGFNYDIANRVALTLWDTTGTRAETDDLTD